MKNNDSILHYLMEKGNSYNRNKDYKFAIDCYDKVLQINPKYTDALY